MSEFLGENTNKNWRRLIPIPITFVTFLKDMGLRSNHCPFSTLKKVKWPCSRNVLESYILAFLCVDSLVCSAFKTLFSISAAKLYYLSDLLNFCKHLQPTLLQISSAPDPFSLILELPDSFHLAHLTKIPFLVGSNSPTSPSTHLWPY